MYFFGDTVTLRIGLSASPCLVVLTYKIWEIVCLYTHSYRSNCFGCLANLHIQTMIYPHPGSCSSWGSQPLNGQWVRWFRILPRGAAIALFFSSYKICKTQINIMIKLETILFKERQILKLPFFFDGFPPESRCSLEGDLLLSSLLAAPEPSTGWNRKQ